MFVSSVIVVFSSEDDSSLQSASIHLTPSVGCTLSHTIEFVSKNPIVKSYLRNKYRIINFTFKYSKL
nr:MAG TPA: hypothetical protein [Microviridae sp.]